jgi:hypothetical protein
MRFCILVALVPCALLAQTSLPRAMDQDDFRKLPSEVLVDPAGSTRPSPYATASPASSPRYRRSVRFRCCARPCPNAISIKCRYRRRPRIRSIRSSCCRRQRCAKVGNRDATNPAGCCGAVAGRLRCHAASQALRHGRRCEGARRGQADGHHRRRQDRRLDGGDDDGVSGPARRRIRQTQSGRPHQGHGGGGWTRSITSPPSRSRRNVEGRLSGSASRPACRVGTHADARRTGTKKGRDDSRPTRKTACATAATSQ